MRVVERIISTVAINFPDFILTLFKNDGDKYYI